MFKSLPLLSLLLLQLVNPSLAQKYIYATIDGVLESWLNTNAGVATAAVSGHKLTFTYTPSSVTTPTTKAHPTHAPDTPVPVPVPTQHTTHHRADPRPKPTPAASSPQTSKAPKPTRHPAAKQPPKQNTKHHNNHHTKHHNNQKSHPRPANHGNSPGSQSPSSGNPSVTHNPTKQGVSGSGQKVSPSPSSSSSSNNGMTIGLAVGFSLLALIIIAAAGAYFYMRRRRKSGYTSAASSFNEEGKPGQKSSEDLVTQSPYALNVEPTLPAVAAAPSPRNSFGSGAASAIVPVAWSTGQPMVVPSSQPWAPRTPSRLSQIPETVATAENPPQYNIPRRPVGRDST